MLWVQTPSNCQEHIYWRQHSLHHCCFWITQNFVLEQISELQTPELEHPHLFVVRALSITAKCNMPKLHGAVGHDALAQGSKNLLHSPSRSGSGAPQTDWSWCPSQRYSSCLPHTGSSKCCILHALAVCPKMSWRPPRLFPGILKARERSGVSTIVAQVPRLLLSQRYKLVSTWIHRTQQPDIYMEMWKALRQLEMKMCWIFHIHIISLPDF